MPSPNRHMSSFMSILGKGINYSNIHGEVKEAESMKGHSDGVGSRMEQNKEGKNSNCSLLPFDYIYTYTFMHCENKGLFNAYMIEMKYVYLFKVNL